MTDLNEIPVTELELSVRTSNGLRNMGIETVAQFLTFSLREFADMPYIGRISVQEVQDMRDHLRSQLPVKPTAADAGSSREARLSELVGEVNRLIDGSTLLSLRVGRDGLLELHRRII